MGFCTRTRRAEIPIPPPETKGRKKVVSCEQTLQSLVFSHTHTHRESHGFRLQLRPPLRPPGRGGPHSPDR